MPRKGPFQLVPSLPRNEIWQDMPDLCLNLGFGKLGLHEGHHCVLVQLTEFRVAELNDA